MTLLAAKLLDTAWATFQAVASAPDESGLSNQTPSWLKASTPYDHAAELVQSLLPHAYNYPASDVNTTQAIYTAMIECGEVLSISAVAELTDEFYDFKGLGALHGQRLTVSPSAPAEWTDKHTFRPYDSTGFSL